MRIFLSCQQALRAHSVPGYSFWEYYFKSSLKEEGHEYIEAPEVDWAEGLTQMTKRERVQWLERTWTRTLEFLQKEHSRKPVDMFLGYLFPDQVDTAAVRAIRELGIPTVNFFCDNVREFTSIPEAYHPFDLHWVPESEARQLYKAANLMHVYAPMPMWVRPEFRGLPTSESERIVFIGSRDDLREDLLGEAVSLGLDLTVQGPSWIGSAPAPAGPRRSIGRTLVNQISFLRKEGLRGFAMRETYRKRKVRDTSWIEKHSAPMVTGEDYFNALREAQVSLGVNRYPSFRSPFDKALTYSRLRDIEAPMLGACYLTEATPGLSDLYEIGTEIETFSSAQELVEKATRLQGDKALRRSMREKGQRKALGELTIGKSLGSIAKALSINPA